MRPSPDFSRFLEFESTRTADYQKCYSFSSRKINLKLFRENDLQSSNYTPCDIYDGLGISIGRDSYTERITSNGKNCSNNDNDDRFGR